MSEAMGLLRKIIRVLKKIPIDLGQYEMRYTTKGKMIAWQFVGSGGGGLHLISAAVTDIGPKSL